MIPTLTCLAVALVGVDLGYRPASNGGVEFVIHVNPATFQSVRPGELDINVSRLAREMRLSHINITPGNERLPGEVSVATSLPPATAPIVSASPVMPATAAVPTSPSAMPPGREPLRFQPPSYSAPSTRTEAHGWPLLMPNNRGSSPATPTSADSRMGGLPPVNMDGSAAAQPSPPWLGMCLLVIALLASNVYVGWLFWDARQRYRGLLTRTFSFGQQAAEA